MKTQLVKAFVIPALFAFAACSDHGTAPVPEVAAVSVTIPAPELEMGQSITAIAVALDQFGAPIDKGPVTWSSTFPPVAVVQPTTGQILAINSGMTQIIATVAGKEGHRALIVSPPPILINEVNPNGDGPGGWVELFNPIPEAVEMTGWTITGSDGSQKFAFAAGTSIPSGGYLIVEEASFPLGLKASDAVHLFSRFGVQSDATSWQSNAATTYGRCPDGVGPFNLTVAASKGATNICA